MEDKKLKCPICKKETDWEDNLYRPFCSERCRLMDLGKWASEEYRISGEKKGTPAEGTKGKNNTEKAG